jgi:hypothetical protein
MKSKTSLFILLLCLGINLKGSCQYNFLDFKPKISGDVFLGPTLSFSSGDFIDDQREFSSITYSDADIKGKIRPNIFYAVGAQGRFSLYEQGIPANFSLSLGFFYHQRGFKHIYSFNYLYENLDIEDKMNYTETYKINHVAIPFLLRYGKKWFVEAGFLFSGMMSAKRIKTLDREVSGSDATDGGFDTREVNRYLLNDAVLNNKPISLMFNVGAELNNRFSLRLTNHFNRTTFSGASDFQSYNLQLHFLINLFNLNPTFKFDGLLK